MVLLLLLLFLAALVRILRFSIFCANRWIKRYVEFHPRTDAIHNTPQLAKVPASPKYDTGVPLLRSNPKNNAVPDEIVEIPSKAGTNAMNFEFDLAKAEMPPGGVAANHAFSTPERPVAVNEA